MQDFLKRWFYKQGRLCAKHPIAVIIACIVFTVGCSFGIFKLSLQSDPQKLWVPPTSRSANEQNYFNDRFGSFFRISQVILTARNSSQPKDIINRDAFLNLYYVMRSIKDSTIMYKNVTYGLNDFCFKPISDKGCVVMNPFDYWHMDLDRFHEDYDNGMFKQRMQCIHPQRKEDMTCTDEAGVPIMPTVIYGRLGCDESVKPTDPCGKCASRTAEALVVNVLLQNDWVGDKAEAVKIWEKKVFLEMLDAYNERGGVHRVVDPRSTVQFDDGSNYPLKASFMAARSIEDDLEAENSQNAFVVVVSYVAMFIYISMALGDFPHPIRSRFLLGLSGIFIVVMSLAISIGLCSIFGVELSLIISEVVPFLILAIGVDNMFIIAKAVERVDHPDPIERIAHGLSRVGASISAAAFSEFLAFMVGATTAIPALTSFSFVAAIAVLADYLLQITCFVSFLALDMRRVRSARYDCVPCVETTHDRWDVSPAGQPTWFANLGKKDFAKKLIDDYYNPILFKPVSKIIVGILFVCLIAVTVVGIPRMTLGLNEQVTLITGSDIFNYFQALEEYGEAGPPAYAVLRDVDYEDHETQQGMLDLQDGLSKLEVSVESPVYSWFGVFNQWQNPTDPQGATAIACKTTDIQKYPFYERVKKFMETKVNSPCCQQYGLCGEAYFSDIVLGKDKNNSMVVSASRLRFQHTALKVQGDYIRDLNEGRAVVDFYAKRLKKLPMDRRAVERVSIDSAQLTASVGGSEITPSADDDQAAFAYSLFYVFYEQYSYIRGVAVQNILLAVGAVFLATQFITNFTLAVFVAFNVLSTTCCVVGLLWVWNQYPGYIVEVNAVSVVNLVMAVGLSVEFCVHIAISFLKTDGTREHRAKQALSSMGSSVLVGIATTKLLGVIVLAFAPSTLFQLYYFRMYVCIIVSGLFHGLAVLPIVLSLIGPAPIKGATWKGSFAEPLLGNETAQYPSAVMPIDSHMNGESNHLNGYTNGFTSPAHEFNIQ
eukprot:GILK01002081.1.p1 GENE.GILK01002081.1~~GILK01002081.1.p1  ORF type:complete len:1013 (+),score=204.17 GILK01002081.1:56-3040(+)